VPDNLAGNSFAFKIVKGDIQEELTQARAKFKKLVRKFFQLVNVISRFTFLQIRDSLAVPAKDSDSIFDLATTVIANSKSSVTVPLCARLALLVSCLSLIFIILTLHLCDSGKFMLNVPMGRTGTK
jgi:hypothetical protein